MNIDVSIILPVYNAEKTVKKTIESIMTQEFKNYELIIINDGSTDNTLNICREYSMHEKVKIINIENSGPSNARNVGIRECVGRYIMFIDSDDIYTHNMVSIMYNLIEDKKCELVCCNYSNISKEKIINNNNITEHLYQKNELFEGIEQMINKKVFNIIWNKIYKTDIIKSNNIYFDKNIELGEDYCFNIDYFEKINSLYVTNQFLYLYRIMANSICTKFREDMFQLKYTNIKHNEEMYIRKHYNVDSLADKYIDCFKSTLLSLKTDKNFSYIIKKNKIKEYNDVVINELSKRKKYKLSKENSILKFFIFRKYINILYLYISLKMQLKRIKCILKKEQYR